MNGSDIKAVIDTNILFMALYNLNGKAGKILSAANENKIQLFSTDTVKEEIKRVLERELKFNKEKIDFILESLPIVWLEKGIYSEFLNKTKVKHKADKPIEALALALDLGVLTADKKFAKSLGHRIINVNRLLNEIEL